MLLNGSALGFRELTINELRDSAYRLMAITGLNPRVNGLIHFAYGHG